MKIIRKDASIENTGTDSDFPGTFRVVLSAPTEDRDGDTLLADEWKLPLPSHITFDTDHGMSVVTTVGSGVPAIDETSGELIVEGSYSSLPRAQETRTLVNEGHIRTTSVAFMTVPSTAKGGKITSVRELLNGAFVAVPSNREALVLESKGLGRKVGARNSSTDSERIQQIHDLTLQLGASADGVDDSADETAAEKRFSARRTKSIDGSLEQLQERISDALRETYQGWVWLRATVPSDGGGQATYDVEDPDTYDSTTWRESYTYDGTTVTLAGDRQAVEVTQQIIPDTSSTSTATSPAAGAGAPAAGEKAATDAEELQVRAAQIRSFMNIHTTPEGSTT